MTSSHSISEWIRFTHPDDIFTKPTMKTRSFLLITLITSLALSCKDTSTNPEQGSHAKIFLESEYINFAWGYAHNGWVIDSAGNIISYDIAKSGTQWTGNPSGYYTGQELWNKVHHCDTLRGFVPSDTLQWLRALAAASVGGAYSDTTCPARDMGSFVYSCYVYNPDSLKFRQIVLRVHGDCEFYNTATSAIKLSNWMALR
jgi:hypothetical protein